MASALGNFRVVLPRPALAVNGATWTGQVSKDHRTYRENESGSWGISTSDQRGRYSV